MNIQITDRYQATGTPYPTKDSCDTCEGMGIYPTQKVDLNKHAVEAPRGKLIIVGQKEENGTPCEEDGWVFIKCPDCFGTRKKNPTEEEIIEQLKKMFISNPHN